MREIGYPWILSALIALLCLPCDAVEDASAAWTADWRVLHFDPARDLDPHQVAPTQAGPWRSATCEGRIYTAKSVLPDDETDSVYAQAVIEASREAEIDLELGFVGTCTAWWNSEKVVDFASSPGPPEKKVRKIKVETTKGKNTLLLRLETSGEPARWCTRLR